MELIEALAPRLGGRQLAAMAVEAMVDAVLREVAAGGTVGITGFGTFEKVDRAPRTGRNPHTGAPVPIAATSSPRFRPGAYFKEVVADPDRLPTDGLAGVRVGSHGEMADPEPASRPSSVRRSAGPGRTGEQAPDRTATTAGQAGAEGDPGRSRRRRAASGTPATVRARQDGPADRSAPADSPERAGDAAERATPARAGRALSGGQDITMGMITAKKAELARVKNDDVVAADERSGKKTSGKDKGKGKSKDKPGKGRSGGGKGKTKAGKDKGGKDQDKGGKVKDKGGKVKKSAKKSKDS